MMVADTDVLIDFLRGAESMASRIELELQKAGLSTTAVNAFELRSGAMGKKEKQQVDTLLAALGILPLCEAAAQRAAAIRRELEDRGASIGMADYLIEIWRISSASTASPLAVNINSL